METCRHCEAFDAQTYPTVDDYIEMIRIEAANVRALIPTWIEVQGNAVLQEWGLIKPTDDHEPIVRNLRKRKK